MQNERKNRFTDSELALIKSIFADNEPILMALRKFLYGGTLNETESVWVKGLSPEGIAVIKKIVLPQLELDSPLFGAVDLWANINTKEQSLQKSYEEMLARKIVEDYLEKQIELLSGKKVKNINLFSLHKMEDKNPEDAVIDLAARNTIISHIDIQLYQAKVLAGHKEESVEETQQRLQKNSTQ